MATFTSQPKSSAGSFTALSKNAATWTGGNKSAYPNAGLGPNLVINSSFGGDNTNGWSLLGGVVLGTNAAIFNAINGHLEQDRFPPNAVRVSFTVSSSNNGSLTLGYGGSGSFIASLTNGSHFVDFSDNIGNGALTFDNGSSSNFLGHITNVSVNIKGEWGIPIKN